MRAPPTPAKPGQKCEFSAWVFSDGTDGGGDKFFFNVQDGTGKFLAQAEPLINPDTPIWRRVLWSVELPAGTARLGVSVMLNSTKGFIWVDDISILLDGQEALKGGTFEP
jgi:hypothetical protein